MLYEMKYMLYYIYKNMKKSNNYLSLIGSVNWQFKYCNGQQ